MTARKKKAVLQGLTLQNISPLTDAQRDMVEAYNEGYNLLLHGVAGTGKTLMSLYLALKDVMEGKFKKLIIIRSAVASRDPGFLPGTLEEKSKPYEEVYVTLINDKIFERPDAWQTILDKGMVEFRTTAHLRSLTFDDSIIFVDEIQNLGFGELDTAITRVGNNSRIIFCGDIVQNDLTKSKYDITGLPDFIKIIETMTEEFDLIEFEVDDIVRGGLVKSYIIAKMNLGVG